MAVAVIAGILFATFLTLVLVPVMYSLVDDASDFITRHFRHAHPPEAARDAHGGAASPDAAVPGGRRGGSAEEALEPEVAGVTRAMV